MLTLSSHYMYMHNVYMLCMHLRRPAMRDFAGAKCATRFDIEQKKKGENFVASRCDVFPVNPCA